MVIVNPKLSLPFDLPYKKRQSPFNPHSALQAATMRYNEAIRKQYNDIQFAKRFEIGCIAQNELTPVNTIDVGKYLDPALMSEMSRLNPLPSTSNKNNRKFRRLEICKGMLMRDDVPPALPHSSITETRFHVPTPPDGALAKTNCSTRCDCCGDNTNDNDEMFPPLGVGNDHHDKCVNSRASPLGRSIKQSRSLAAPEHTNNNNVQVLEAQAIHEYSPTVDSAHDMIFGNVMGLDYGNYVHDRLWPATTTTPAWNPATEHQIADHRDTCTVSKSAGYNLAGGCGSRDSLKSSGELITMNIGGASSAGHSSTGSSRRSTSVPRPRTGSRKETLKQAAIRCGIIKGNCNVIQKRSHYLVPLQLPPSVQSDQTVPVVEILHPRSLIPTCSSEALVEEMKDQIADAEFKKEEEVVCARDTKSIANLLGNNSEARCGRSRRDFAGMHSSGPLLETCSDDGSYNNSRSNDNARRGEVRSTFSDQYT